jgi:hypothetical protein
LLTCQARQADALNADVHRQIMGLTSRSANDVTGW